MRRIGSISDPRLATRLCDYLQTQSIDARTDTDEREPEPPRVAGGSGGTATEGRLTAYDIWVREERDLDRAKEIFRAFKESPDDPKYDVSKQAEAIRREKDRDARRRIAQQKKAQQKLRGRGGFGGRSPMSGSIPVTIGVIVIASVVGFATNFATIQWSRGGAEPTLEEKIFDSLSSVERNAYLKSGDPFISVKQGQLWRVITPMFLHGATLHLAFNMIALYMLGSVVERLHGSVFLAALLLVSQIGGQLTQMSLPMLPLPPILQESPLAIGASGAVFGVFGFIWIRPRVQPMYPVEIPPVNVAFMLGFLFLCMTPLIQGIANGAHLGGLVIGVIVARLWPAG